MRIEKVILMALTLPILATQLHPQETLSVDEQILAQHVEHQVEPVYPPIAIAAHIQGSVVIEITVGATGKIESIKVVKGPAMLQQAALDCIKQWAFRPFDKDGTAVSATGHISIVFDLDKYLPSEKEADIVSHFASADKKCKKALAVQDNALSAADLCKRAADIADQFGPGVRFIDQSTSFVSAAWALNKSGRFPEALVYSQKAVAVVMLGHDDDSRSAAAYGVLGITESILKSLDPADRDLTTAEDFERKAIAWADETKFKQEDSFKNALKLYLKTHATVLLALNRPEDAQKKLYEASKFQ
jgi:TonB family protein